MKILNNNRENIQSFVVLCSTTIFVVFLLVILYNSFNETKSLNIGESLGNFCAKFKEWNKEQIKKNVIKGFGIQPRYDS